MSQAGCYPAWKQHTDHWTAAPPLIWPYWTTPFCWEPCQADQTTLQQVLCASHCDPTSHVLHCWWRTPVTIAYLLPRSSVRKQGRGQGYVSPSGIHTSGHIVMALSRQDMQLHWLQPHKAGKGRALPFSLSVFINTQYTSIFSFFASDGWLYVYEMFSFIWRQGNQNQLKLWQWREGKQVCVGPTVPLAPWAVQG